MFADWTRQKQAAQLGLQTPLRIEGASGGTNQNSAHTLVVEGAAFTTAAEEQMYINEVNILLPPITPDNPPVPSIQPGTVLWATNCGGIDSSDNGYSITTDYDGNVYVTGVFIGTMTIKQYASAPSGGGAVGLSTYGILTSAAGSLDIFIIKYNSLGQVLWATSCGGANIDEGRSITIDTIGNIYIIGNYRNILTIKQYDSAPIGGGTIGLSTYGTITSVNSLNDIFVIKYNSSGQVLWAASCGGSSTEQGNSITTDKDNNVYVTGSYQSTMTIKQYASAPSGGGAVGLSIYGTLTSSGGQDIFIIKYNSSGQALWATSCGGTSTDQGNSITTDKDNNVYVTGNFIGIMTIKQYASAPSGGGAVGLSTYGTLTSSGGPDIYIIKYNLLGQALWATSSGSSSTDQGNSITTDKDNNVYVTGNFNGTMTIKQYASAPSGGGAVGLSIYGTITTAGLSDIYIVKYNSIGQVLWGTSCGSSLSDNCYSVAADNENIYLTGTFKNAITIKQFASAPVSGGAIGLSTYGTLTTTNTGTDDIFILKYNSSGQVVWATNCEGSGGELSYSIATDNYGNVYITGSQDGSESIMTIKQYDSAPVAGGDVGLSIYGTLKTEGYNNMFIIKYKA